MNTQPNSISPSNAWMVVYVATSEPEAYIVAGRLQSEGIQAFVHQEPVAKAYGFNVGTFGGIKVLVNAGDYDQAEAILEQDAEAENSEDTDIVLDDDEVDDYEIDDDYNDEYDDDDQ